jgi:hypothetical protein
MSVEWRTVVGWDQYEVSSDGYVRVKGKKAPKRTYLSNGYVCTQLSCHGFKKRVYLHRLVATAFCPGDPGLTVNHKDGNRQNNCASNLEWVDVATNTRLMHLRLGHNLKQPVQLHPDHREIA